MRADRQIARGWWPLSFLNFLGAASFGLLLAIVLQ